MKRRKLSMLLAALTLILSVATPFQARADENIQYDYTVFKARLCWSWCGDTYSARSNPEGFNNHSDGADDAFFRRASDIVKSKEQQALANNHEMVGMKVEFYRARDVSYVIVRYGTSATQNVVSTSSFTQKQLAGFIWTAYHDQLPLGRQPPSPGN